MSPRLRKLALTAHVAAAVGWLGAVVAYLALAVSGLTDPDARTARAAYLSMEVVGWCAVVPLALAALATGVVQSLSTEWGLFRYYWVLAKFLLTVGAVTVLLLHMPAVSRMAGVAAETPLAGPDFRESRVQLVVHAGGGLLVLLATTALSVFKPWGRTPFGKRKPDERRKAPPGEPAAPSDRSGAPESTPAPESRPPLPASAAHGRGSRASWWLYVLLAVVGLIVLFVVAHLASGGRGHH